MTHKRVHVIINGYVQGVGYRASCARQAHALRVKGWVRNQWDGSVEALFEGPEDKVAEMIAWCHRGPMQAAVTSVEVEDAPTAAAPERGFYVRG